MPKKILIAFDDSSNALRAVEFVAQSFKTEGTVTLFHVIQDSSALCDINSPELTPYFLSQKATFCALEEEKQRLVEAAMQKAQTALEKAGFGEGHVRAKIVRKQDGIARDIVQEFRSGYDLIVMGRRGLAGIQEFIMGSVSHKVFNLLKNETILFVN